jgi:hypothetical protein
MMGWDIIFENEMDGDFASLGISERINSILSNRKNEV